MIHKEASLEKETKNSTKVAVLNGIFPSPSHSETEKLRFHGSPGRARVHKALGLWDVYKSHQNLRHQ